MKAKFKLLSVLIVAFSVMSFLGCSKKEDVSQEGHAVEADSSSQISAEAAPDQPANGGNTQIAVKGISLSDVVALWDTGQKDAAIAKFLSINWQDASVLKQIRGLNMSEHDLISLSENDRNRIVQETVNLLSSMRKLFFHVASEAERLAGSGNRTKAEEYLGAIRKYGNSLSGPDHLHVVQMHGKAATGYAEKKLSDLQ
jgi:hypothetical protein